MEHPAYTNPESTDPRTPNVFQTAHIAIESFPMKELQYRAYCFSYTFERYKSFVIKIAIGYIFCCWGLSESDKAIISYFDIFWYFGPSEKDPPEVIQCGSPSEGVPGEAGRGYSTDELSWGGCLTLSVPGSIISYHHIIYSYHIVISYRYIILSYHPIISLRHHAVVEKRSWTAPYAAKIL